jgi:hypothetical protein
MRLVHVPVSLEAREQIADRCRRDTKAAMASQRLRRDWLTRGDVLAYERSQQPS